MAQRSRKPGRRSWTAVLTGAAVLAAGLLVFAGVGSAARATKPTNTTPPSIYGNEKQGEAIHADHGDWTPTPDSYQYQWFRCDSGGSNCNAVTSVSSSNDYSLGSNDVGKRMYVSVRAINSGDTSDWADSAKSGVIVASGSAPSNTSKPTISGTAQDNQTLTASPGSWSGNPTKYTYAWRRCDSKGDNCNTIATGQTYRVTSNDVGHRLRVQVVAQNSIGSSTATSDPTDVVAAAGAGPKNTAAPKITGTAQDNQTLTVNAGTWTGNTPISFTYQWLRCDANGNNCGNIGGANDAKYRATSNDVGHRLRAAVTAKNPVGTSTAVTGPTAVVAQAGAAGAIKLSNGTTSIPVSSVSLPDRLVIDKVQFTPKFISTRNEQVIAKFRVVDGNGYVVRDALVYAIGVPANRVSAPAETKTDQTGWATVSYIPQKGLPIKQGARLTIFVRARKPGDSVLAGVSTRRLVSIAVHPA